MRFGTQFVKHRGSGEPRGRGQAFRSARSPAPVQSIQSVWASMRSFSTSRAAVARATSS